MDINSATALARSLMTEHGVGYMQFGFASSVGQDGLAGGITHYARGFGGAPWIPSKITLSLPWVEHLPESKVREIILHEICHALVPHGTGHGPAWQNQMVKIGLPPNVRFSYPTVPEELMK